MNKSTFEIPVPEFGEIPVLKHVLYEPPVQEPPAPKQVEVILKATSIAVIQLPDGESKIVLFRPTAATMKAVKDYEGYDIDLHVEDENGLFGPKRPQRIVSSVYEPGNRTMIVDAEDQDHA